MFRTLLCLALMLAPASAWATSYTITNTFTASTTAVASQVNANFSGAKTAIDENSLRLDSILNSNTCNSSPCDLAASITIGGSLALIASDIGVTVQAYDADLADLADGSLSGSKVGTGLDAAIITTGTIASTARLPAAVIESTEIDTSAELNAIILDTDFLTAEGTYNQVVTGSAIFSGTLQGGVMVSTNSTTTGSPIATQMLGVMYVCTNAAGCDITLPAVAAGLNACFYDNNGGGVIILDAAAGDEIVLDGVGVGVADAIDSAGAKGDFVCILGIDTTYWLTLGRSGTFIDGGID